MRNKGKQFWDFFFFFMFYFLPFFFPSFLLTTLMFGTKKQSKIKMVVLYHGLLAFAVREPLLPPSPQNMLDHDCG